jgi:hypothetical protein
MRLSPITIALAVLLAAGCASGPPKTDSSGLVRVPFWRGGNLFAHPTLSIDDYDDIWLAEIGIQYAEEQKPLAESDERAIRKMVYDIALAEVPTAKQLGVREAGPCTLKMGVHLAALAFPRPGFTGPRNRGAAVVIFEFRDSQINEPLVRYGQRRELSSVTRKTDGGPDLERLAEIVHDILADVGTALRDSLPVNPTGARAAQGCQSVIGDVRREAKARAR